MLNFPFSLICSEFPFKQRSTINTLHPSKSYTMKEKTTLELLPPAGFGIIELDGMVLCFVDKSAQGSRGANLLKSSSSYLVENAFTQFMSSLKY